MAGMLLCVMTVCGPMFGCLLPQDDQVIDALPKKKNSPLFLIPDNAQPPQQRIAYYSSTQCNNPVFSIGVKDEDLSDTMRSLWFIDKGVGNTVVTYSPTPVGASTTSSGRQITAPTASFTNALANLTPGTHLVTVYVTDSEFEEVATPMAPVRVRRAQVVLPDGQTAPDTAYVVSFTWVLDVEPCP
jgi:hypothetical protein